MKPLTNKINKLDIAIQNNEAVIKKNAIRQSQQDGIFYEEKIMIHLLDNSNKFDTMPRMKETTTKPTASNSLKNLSEAHSLFFPRLFLIRL